MALTSDGAGYATAGGADSATDGVAAEPAGAPPEQAPTAAERTSAAQARTAERMNDRTGECAPIPGPATAARLAPEVGLAGPHAAAPLLNNLRGNHN
jgi:hypothetical protein